MLSLPSIKCQLTTMVDSGYASVNCFLFFFLLRFKIALYFPDPLIDIMSPPFVVSTYRNNPSYKREKRVTPSSKFLVHFFCLWPSSTKFIILLCCFSHYKFVSCTYDCQLFSSEFIIVSARKQFTYSHRTRRAIFTGPHNMDF